MTSPKSITQWQHTLAATLHLRVPTLEARLREWYLVLTLCMG